MRHHSLSRRPGGRAGLAALAASITLAATACGGAVTDSSATASTGQAPAAAGAADGPVRAAQADLDKYRQPVRAYPEVPKVPGVSALKGKNVWYVPIGSAVPALAALGAGMQDSLTKAGLVFHTCDGKFLPTAISSCLSQAAAQGADAVVTGYVDYALIPTAFDELLARHIPVLLAGAAPSGGKTSNKQLAFADNNQTIQLVERLSMDAVISDSGGRAKVLLVGVSDSPHTKGTAAYASTYLKEHCSSCSLTETDYSTASLSKLPSQVSSALLSHPDTTHVVIAAPVGQQVLAGIDSAGFTDKVRLAGVNGSIDALQRVKVGRPQFVDVGGGPIYGGWQFSNGILQMLTGQDAHVGLGVVRVFSPDNVAGLTLTPAAYATNAWYGNDDYQKTFLSAWGVS